MRFTILLIILLVLTTLGIVSYNYYESSYAPQSSNLEEGQSNPPPPQNNNEPLTPEDLPPLNLPDEKVPKESFQLVPQAHGEEKGVLNLNTDNSGSGSVTFYNPAQEQFQSFDFTIENGIVKALGVELGISNQQEHIICLSGSLPDIYFSRCFATNKAIDNAFAQHEDELRNQEEQSLINDSQMQDLAFQDQMLQEESQSYDSEEINEDNSFNFGG